MLVSVFDNQFYIIQTSDFTIIETIDAYDTGSFNMQSASYNSDGTQIVTCGYGNGDHVLRIWDTQDFSLVHSKNSLEEIPYIAIFAFHDTQIISGHDDGSVNIWKAYGDYGILKTITDHEWEILWVMVSFDKKRLMTASYDYTVKIFDIENDYRLIQTIQGQDDIEKIQSKSDSQIIYIGDYSGNVLIYELSWECLGNSLTDLIDYFFYNGDCEITRTDLEQCLTSLQDLETDNSIFTVSTQNIDSTNISVELTQQPTQIYNHIDTCAFYRLTIFEEVYEQSDLDITMPPTIKKNLSVSDVENLSCTEDDQTTQIVYTCASQFQIFSNFTLQYQENFNLVMTISNGGSFTDQQISNQVQEIVQEVPTVNVDTLLVFCSIQQQYDITNCQNQQLSTQENPIIVNVSQESKLILRHQITEFYDENYNINLVYLKLNQLIEQIEIPVTIENQGAGFIDFSFMQQITEDVMELEVVSKLNEIVARRMRNLNQNYENQLVLAKIFMKYEELVIQEEVEEEVEEEVQGELEQQDGEIQNIQDGEVLNQNDGETQNYNDGEQYVDPNPDPVSDSSSIIDLQDQKKK